ncbi:MAG: elongation factor P--(R)-beta-lysine ligase [Pseudomonadota bacterium]
MTDWRPSATIETLRERAAFFASIRAFFLQRDVLEVDTPCLSQDTITDVHIEPFSTTWSKDNRDIPQTLYLQTSPEYYMKRLLASGSGDIFYLGKCFRNENVSPLHQPEFTMLEWYRCGFDMQLLINEVKQLIQLLLKIDVQQKTYQQAFIHHLSFDPLTLSDMDVTQLARQYDLEDYLRNFASGSLLYNARKDALLDVLFSRFIELPMSKDKAMIVTHFPASQASLAKLSSDGKTAERFELYINGKELANGFAELTDPCIQRQRFEKDNQIRALLGKTKRPIDNRLLSALDVGMPECAGVAIGLDRLFMLKQGFDSIQQSVPFSL